MAMGQMWLFSMGTGRQFGWDPGKVEGPSPGTDPYMI